MNNLKKIKIEQERIAQMYEITSALRVIAATQSRQLNKKKKDYEPVRTEAARILYYLHSLGSLPVNTSQKRLHIIFSTDQKFCKKFLNSLHDLILSSSFQPNDKVLLFGWRTYKVVSTMLPPEQIEQYRALSTFDECESIALRLKRDNYPNTFLYTYDNNSNSSKRLAIVPFCSDVELFNKYNDKIKDIYYTNEQYEINNLLHLYLSSEIYTCMIESGLKERIDRAIAMSESSSNAEIMAAKLKRMYNATRQAMITKEITNGS